MRRTQRIPRDMRIWYIVLFAAVALFILLSFARIHQIVAEDDLWAVLLAAYFNGSGAQRDATFYANPHLFVHCVAMASKIFGAGAAAARVVGIISGVMSICLMFIVVKASCPGDKDDRIRLAAITSALYALAPTTIQNTVTIGIDNTILIPAVLCIFLAMIRYVQDGKLLWAAAIACAVAIALWARLSTPFILVAILAVLIMLTAYKNSIKRVLIGSLIAGPALFLVTWYLYCKAIGASFFGPALYFLQTAGGCSQHLAAKQLLQNFVYLALWLGVFFLPAIVVVLPKKRAVLLRDLRISPHLILISGIVLFTGFSIFGGTSFGYCRYHAPIIPLIYIGIALVMAKTDFEGLGDRKTQIFLMISLLILVFIVRDLLYVFRYTLREYKAFEYVASFAGLRSALARIAIACVLYSTLFCAYRWMRVRMALSGVLIVLAAASALTMTLYQSIAAYNTGYNYGERGAAAAAAFINEKIPAGSIVVAPGELAYYMGFYDNRDSSSSFWNDRGKIIRKLGDPKVSAFVYSITCNTVGQVRIITRDPLVQATLRDGFTYTKIGSYDIWIRR